MKSSGKREKTIYDDSLTRIFLWSGFTMFMLLLIVCIIIGITVLFYRRSDSEGIKTILFCLALVIPGSYGIPFISLLKVWKQERRLGIYWKDRTDYDRPEWERDWYLTCDRGGFILYHRNFIRRIVGRQVETEIAEHARGKVYYVVYEDVDGKIRKLKFSSDSLASEFLHWFKKQVYKEMEENE